MTTEFIYTKTIYVKNILTFTLKNNKNLSICFNIKIQKFDIKQHMYTVSQKNCTIFVSSITLSKVDRF